VTARLSTYAFANAPQPLGYVIQRDCTKTKGKTRNRWAIDAEHRQLLHADSAS
jgi:hypothetical protein